MKMNGKEVFKHAVRRMEASAKECLDAAGIAEESISWLIPHQANIRIMEAIGKRFNIPWERVVRILAQLCRALSAAHAENVVHRDLPTREPAARRISQPPRSAP